MALIRGGLMVKLSLEKQREKLNEDVQSLSSVLNEDDALIFKDEKSLQMLLHNKGREACNSRSVNPNLEISPSVDIVPRLPEKGNNERSHLIEQEVPVSNPILEISQSAVQSEISFDRSHLIEQDLPLIEAVTPNLNILPSAEILSTLPENLRNKQSDERSYKIEQNLQAIEANSSEFILTVNSENPTKLCVRRSSVKYCISLADSDDSEYYDSDKDPEFSYKAAKLQDALYHSKLLI